MFKLDLEKAEEPEMRLPTSILIIEKAMNSRKISASLTMLKHLTMWITTNGGKYWKWSEYQITWPASWEICMQVRKQQLELDVEQQTDSKSGKEDVRLYIVTLLTYMQSESEVSQLCPTLCGPMDCSLSGSSVHGIFQARVLGWVAISFSRGSSRPKNWTQVSHIAGRHFTVWATREALVQSTSCKMLGWLKHKLESRFLGEISISSDMQITPLLWQKVKKN